MWYYLVVASSYGVEKINNILKKGFFNLRKPYNMVNYINYINRMEYY